MTKIIGLTGGIGSGKTTLAKYFESFGVPVYIADEQAKKILNLPAVQKQIRAVFGESVFKDNKIDRQQLAAIVFRDSQKLDLLNSIVHPAVKEDFHHWLSEHKEQPILIKEAAILFESGSYKDCDEIITVTAPLETRVERILSRDNTSREAILERMNNQWTDEMRIAQSDYVIDNRNLDQAKQQANKILKKLLNQ